MIEYENWHIVTVISLRITETPKNNKDINSNNFSL